MNPADDHRDHELDATWRAASREEPPAALDAAIAAAARRAVGAGPRAGHASRTWWPVAAAAAVAVVAIGIVEMTPPDEVAPTIVAPSPERRPKASASTQASPASGGAPRERGAANTPEPAQELEREAPAASVDAASPALALKAVPPGSNPFPATPGDASVPPAAGAPASTPPAGTTEDARKPAAPRVSGALASRQEQTRSNPPAALAKRASDAAELRGEAPRTVDEWIRLLRRLKIEGKSDLLARELAAFRAMYKDRADELLPADLRGTKP